MKEKVVEGGRRKSLGDLFYTSQKDRILDTAGKRGRRKRKTRRGGEGKGRVGVREGELR